MCTQTLDMPSVQTFSGASAAMSSLTTSGWFEEGGRVARTEANGLNFKPAWISYSITIINLFN